MLKTMGERGDNEREQKGRESKDRLNGVGVKSVYKRDQKGMEEQGKGQKNERNR